MTTDFTATVSGAWSAYKTWGASPLTTTSTTTGTCTATAFAPTAACTTWTVRDACQVEFSGWPTSGTVVTNTGLAGASYNGVLAVNEYALQSTGAQTQVQANTTDYVKVLKGATIDNLQAHTIEFAFYYNAYTSLDSVFQKSGSIYYCYIGSTGILYLYRYDTAGTAYVKWTTPTYSIMPGGFYHVQISWDASSVNNTPIIKINNVTQTLTAAPSGVTTAWKDDSGSDMYIGNNLANTTYINGTIYLLRIHSRALTTAELENNYLMDIWRFFSSAAYVTGCTNEWLFQQTSGTITDDIGGLNLTNNGATPTLGSSGAEYYAFASGNTATAAAPLTLADTFTIEMIFSCSGGDSYPIPAGDYVASPSKNGWIITYHAYVAFTDYSAGPTAILATTGATISASKIYHYTLTYNKNGGSNNLKQYLNGVYATQNTGGAISPVTDASNFSVGWPSPDRYAGQMYLLRVYNTTLTQAQVQRNFNAERWRWWKQASWVQTTVPGCTTATPTVTTSTSSAYTLTTIPTCTTDATSTATSSAVSAYTLTTIPTCTTTNTDTSVPGTGFTETTIPTSTTADTATATPSAVSAYTLTTVPDCSTASLAPLSTIFVSGTTWTQLAIGDATTDTYTPIVGLSLTVLITTVPDCITSSITPTLGESESWSQSSTPDCITTVLGIINGVGNTESVVPSSTTTTVVTGRDIGSIQTIVPTSTSTILSVPISISSAISQTVVPTTTTTSSCPVIGTSESWTQTVVPTDTTTTNLIGPALMAGQTVTPTSIVVDYAPAVLTTWNSTWTQITTPTDTTVTPQAVADIKVQPTVPACTTITTAPVTTLSSNITLKSPACTTITSVPSMSEVGGWLQLITPVAAMDSSLPVEGVEFIPSTPSMNAELLPVLTGLEIFKMRYLFGIGKEDMGLTGLPESLLDLKGLVESEHSLTGLMKTDQTLYGLRDAERDING